MSQTTDIRKKESGKQAGEIDDGGNYMMRKAAQEKLENLSRRQAAAQNNDRIRTTKRTCIITVCLFLLTQTTFAGAINFPDLVDDWSKEAVAWAVDRSIVGGYPDGTFKPHADVLESEWSAMLFKYLEPGKKLDSPGSSHHWADNIYTHMAHYQLPIRGHQHVTARNLPLKRVEIAQITSALYGFNLSDAQAVEFMYDNDFSSGMGGGRYYHTYGVDQNLQRQQAVMFLMKVDNQVKANGGVTFRGEFYPRADGPTGISDGGLKFANTTVDTIDWSRFNPVSQATTALTQEDVTRLRELRDSSKFYRGAWFKDFDEVPESEKEFTIHWITKEYAHHFEGYQAILHPDTIYVSHEGIYIAMGITQKTENGKTYEADAVYGVRPGLPGGTLSLLSEWREVQ